MVHNHKHIVIHNHEKVFKLNLSYLSSYELTQVISEPKPISLPAPSYIDLVFTNQPNLVIEGGGVHALLQPNCHHQNYLRETRI